MQRNCDNHAADGKARVFSFLVKIKKKKSIGKLVSICQNVLNKEKALPQSNSN